MKLFLGGMVIAKALLMLCSGIVYAESPFEGLDAALSGGKVSFSSRLRYEDVSQDNPLKDASVFTVRTRLGYTTAKWNDVNLMVELENTHALGSERYNSGPAVFSQTNGNTAYSTIPDPTGSEVNQYWLGYSGIQDTQIKLGRQRLILDNARFIGNVGWRQNEQTFDGVNIVNKGIPKATINYSYLTRSNFIFFNNFEMSTHLLNLAYDLSENHKLSSYAYLLDFDENVAARRDTRTIGGRAAGAFPMEGFKLLYTLEYAAQDKYKDSPSSVDADYSLAELGLGFSDVTVKAGVETLGGDGTYGFQAPLATAHAFQGWADMFLATPASGVVDSYLNIGGAMPVIGGKWLAVYHDFEADQGGASYGSEIDLLYARPITPSLSVLIKYADYRAETFAVDTRRFWVQAEYKF